jgi:hypothetical protein
VYNFLLNHGFGNGAESFVLIVFERKGKLKGLILFINFAVGFRGLYDVGAL